MRGSVCLDTNLVVLLVIGDARPELIGNHKRLRAYRDADHAALRSILVGAACSVTTHAVLAEASNLIGSGKRGLGDAPLAALASFAVGCFTRDVDVHEVCQHRSFLRLGFADAELVMLAEEDVTVVTDDYALAGMLFKRDLPVINVNNARFGPA